MHIETLKTLRESRNVKLKDIATILGVSLSAMYHYEQGIRQINIVQVLKLAEYYDVSTREIINAQINSTNVREAD